MEQYKKSNWNNEELLYLKCNYNNYTYVELSQKLKRSRSAIQHKVSSLGLSKTQYSNKKKELNDSYFILLILNKRHTG